MTPLGIFYAHKGPRDTIFNQILGNMRRPLKIVQVGGVQHFRADYRVYSGWSDVFFMEHVVKYGGELHVADIADQPLANSAMLVKEYLDETHDGQFGDRFATHKLDGAQFLRQHSDWDLAYLDGSDDPQQMLDQFEALNKENVCILCDDWAIKGSLVAQKYPNFIQYHVKNNSGGMAFYPTKEYEDAAYRNE